MREGTLRSVARYSTWWRAPRVGCDLRHHRARHQLGAGQQRAPQEGHRGAAARVDRAAVARAVAAVVTDRTPVPGQRVDRLGEGVRLVAEPGRGLLEDQRVVHRRARRHRVGAARRLAQHEVRRLREVAGHAEHLLDGVVVRRGARRSRTASRRRRRPSTGPSRLASSKSSFQKRGTLASQCVVPPPTVPGSAFTSPVKLRATPSSASDGVRRVRGSASMSIPGKKRWLRISSPPKTGSASPAGSSRPRKKLRPFSRMVTCQPARASTHGGGRAARPGADHHGVSAHERGARASPALRARSAASRSSGSGSAICSRV